MNRCEVNVDQSLHQQTCPSLYVSTTVSITVISYPNIGPAMPSIVSSTWAAPFESFKPLAHKPLLLVTPGHGGTYTCKTTGPQDPQEPRYIGFSGCYDSIAVYFAIDETRCFAANVNAWVKAGSNDGTIASTKIPVDTDSQKTYDKIAEEVKQRLDRECATAGWAGEKTELMRNSLVMTGRWMAKGSRSTMLQTAVGHAIQDWLEISRAQHQPAERYAALIVEHKGQIVVNADHWLDPVQWAVVNGSEVDLPWQLNVNHA